MPCPSTCILSSDYGDSPEFYHLTNIRKSRIPFHCTECRDLIPPNSPYEKVVGRWGGSLSIFRTCSLCQEIRSYFSCNGTWIFTTVWEDIVDELFPTLTFSCLEGYYIGEDYTPPLCPAAREKVLARWRVWKGLSND